MVQKGSPCLNILLLKNSLPNWTRKIPLNQLFRSWSPIERRQGNQGKHFNFRLIHSTPTGQEFEQYLLGCVNMERCEKLCTLQDYLGCNTNKDVVLAPDFHRKWWFLPLWKDWHRKLWCTLLNLALIWLHQKKILGFCFLEQGHQVWRKRVKTWLLAHGKRYCEWHSYWWISKQMQVCC